MAIISIIRQHNLDNKKARNEVQKLADKLAGELSAEYSWRGDRLEFKRSGADGFIELAHGKIFLEIKLGILLTPLKGHIESTIHSYLDRNLC
ncbi:MAG: polyhydroxyalkanoic acid system family protein [Gammaproteobacteria bacterium]|nr:polyhydroxyalkanoic acid system family protein [Gammaproteobacteria bacterium]MDH3536183.1 polyhydroxyalkanoic acid system family protein [Gammaproteobacteria bacterium]